MFSDSYPCLFYEKYFVMRNNLLLNTSDKEFSCLVFFFSFNPNGDGYVSMAFV